MKETRANPKSPIQFGLSTLLIAITMVAIFFGGRISMQSRVDELEESVRSLEAQKAFNEKLIARTSKFRATTTNILNLMKKNTSMRSIEQGLKASELELKNRLVDNLDIERFTN